jgi:hypothetical protein
VHDYRPIVGPLGKSLDQRPLAIRTETGTLNVDPVRIDTGGIDAVEEIEQAARIGRIRAIAPELQNDAPHVVAVAGEAAPGAAPILRTAIAALLLNPRPPFGAARHLDIGARLLLGDEVAQQRSLSR